MKHLRILTSCLFAIASAASFASEDLFDGTRVLLCATSESAQCTEKEDCVVNPPEANNMPRFLRIDVANKTARAVWPMEAEKVSPVSNVVNGESRLLLQGVDGEVPWSAAIDKTSGHVVVSQSRGAAGFLVFGTCMPE